MLDAKFIRQNAELVKAGAQKKRVTCDVDGFVALDAERRELGVEVDGLRARQKSAGKAMGKASAEERAQIIAEQTELKSGLKKLEERLSGLKAEMLEKQLKIPNVPADDVPGGADDRENVELRKVGEIPKFDFEARDHIEIGVGQGWLHIEAGARLAGSRNYVLSGGFALLEHAIIAFALDHMLAKGFELLSVPMLVRAEPLVGSGYFPGGEEQTYRTDERDDLYLAGTSEVPVTAFHAGEILDVKDLPKRYVARTTCYRREAGTYGKDTRGIYRVHQFQKVEQVILDVADEAKSIEHHHAILQNSEEVMQALCLPYHVVNVCGGDLGGPHVQKFDIEAWMPGRDGYGETHSASRFYDYQARRSNLRYRDAEGKVHTCHTLNNTVAASTRMLLALVEIHQTSDGCVNVPEVLRPYVGGKEVLGKAL